MSLFSRKTEERSISYQDIFANGGNWQSIVSTKTDAQTALRLSAVYACVRLIADGIASLPIDTYSRGADGVPQPQPMPAFLASPSPFVCLYDWVVQLVTSVLMQGNAYGLITSVVNGLPSSIVWLDPCKMVVDAVGFRPKYTYDGVEMDPLTIVHVRGLMLPGAVKGISVLEVASNTFTAGSEAERFGLDFFLQDGVPSGLLSTDNPLNDPDGTKSKKVKEWFKEAVSGRDLAVLGNGLKYSPVSVAPNESQFIEAQEWAVSQAARFFGVPPEMIGGSSGGKSHTYANVEQRSIDFVTYALRPWFTRFERVFSDLIPDPLYVKFDADAMIRTDLLSRYQAYEIGVRSRVLLPNEARLKEDEPPIPGGDKFPVSATPPAVPAKDQTTP